MVFGQKETGAKRVTRATTLRVLFVSFVIDIYGAKNTALIFSEMSFIQFLPLLKKENAILLYFERPFK